MTSTPLHVRHRRFMRSIAATSIFAATICLSPAENKNPARPLAVRELTINHNRRTIQVWICAFDESRYSLGVVDNADGGNQPKFRTLAEAMENGGGVAGCNGGFFVRTPFDPSGLMVCHGGKFGSLDPKSWMQGVLTNRAGHMTLEPSSTFRLTPDVTDALQSGPWLVQDGRLESNLDRRSLARRTFVCNNGQGKWAIGATEECTLQELSVLLKNDSISTIIEVQFALNLDGGPSTGLWAKGAPTDFYLKEQWTVRDYLGVMPKSSASK
jgi:uncharacterized protein YigE (DUF2233 family)